MIAAAITLPKEARVQLYSEMIGTLKVSFRAWALKHPDWVGDKRWDNGVECMAFVMSEFMDVMLRYTIGYGPNFEPLVFLEEETDEASQ